MTGYWLLALLMGGVAAGFSCLALLRPPGGWKRGHTRKEANLRLFRRRREELLEAERSGELPEVLHRELQEELEVSLLDDLPDERPHAAQEDEAPAANERSGRLLLSALLVPLLACFLYADWGLGLGRMQDVALAEELREASETADTERLKALFVRLAERLAGQPDNIDGWLLLAGSGMNLGLYAEAETAFAHLFERFPERLELLESLAEAAYLAADNRITDSVRAFLDRLLSLQPESITALEVLALDAITRGAHEEAGDYLNRLLANPSLTAARQALFVGLRDRLPGAEPGVSLRVQVELRDEIWAAPDETVFVFAGADEGPPISVRRLQVRDLPALVTLDDSASMTGLRLADFPEVRLVARLSRSGAPRAAPGDVQASAWPVSTQGDEVVKLVIGRPTGAATGRNQPDS